MKNRFSLVILLALVPFSFARPVLGAGQYFEVTYPPSTLTNELSIGVSYVLWIPPKVRTLRGVIVHQHGCGEGACRGGATAAYDLHWQALARKWDCALLGPSYHQSENQNCRLWCDPRNGSRTAFHRALSDFAIHSNHPELERVPWCLWGHSGGGFWASLMQTLDPERIVAIWFRSGTAFGTWEKGEIPKPAIPSAAYDIPAMLNPGIKEKGDARFRGAWTASEEMFRAYRAQGAPIGFAADPRTGHECGDSRYLAIPFFDACLALRLPPGNAPVPKLKHVKSGDAWLGPLHGDRAQPAKSFSGNSSEAVWLPSKSVAAAWMEYVKTGATPDTTPPPAPFNVRVTGRSNGTDLTWEGEADFESGLAGFIIERDGQEVARLPEKPGGRFGRPLFQSMSYHDTPERPKDGALPTMRYLDTTAAPGAKHKYRVRSVNSAGLTSTATKAR